MINKFTIDTNGLDIDKLSDLIVSRIDDACISWLSDNTAIITTEKSLTVIRTVFTALRLKPLDTIRPEIKHRQDMDGIEPTHTKLRRDELN